MCKDQSVRTLCQQLRNETVFTPQGRALAKALRSICCTSSPASSVTPPTPVPPPAPIAVA